MSDNQKTAATPLSGTRWKVEKSISIGDLVTLFLLFVSAASYVASNESDKQKIRGSQETLQSQVNQLAAAQTAIDRQQDNQRDDMKKDFTASVLRIEGNVQKLTEYIYTNGTKK